MKKPLIGINPYYFEHRNLFWNGTQEKYYKAVWMGGGIPVTLHYPANGGTIEEIVQSIDGLLTVGGPDLPHDIYGGKSPELLDEDIMHPTREKFDRSLFLAAKKHKIPILSICAGFQHINVIYGGSLYEDLNSQMGGAIYHGEFNGKWVNHPVTLVEDSLIYRVINNKTPEVASTHHQGIWKLGKGLKAVAHSEDGLIEAIEDIDERNAFIAVQWHPEIGLDNPEQVRLFEWLSSESLKRKNMNLT